jgi:peptidoglycan hydrolase-like protein with peptidoglycan-binding domain
LAQRAPVSLAASDKPAWSALPIDDLRQRARASEVGAMEELGRRLLSGTGVPRDVASGATWSQRAGDAGSPTAAFTVGVLYDRGIAGERDSTKAVEWYRKAAAADLPAAKHNLALMLRDGRGAAQDGPKAAELLRAAARRGMTASMFTLGDLYERGGAVLKDPAAALAWFTMASQLERQAAGSETPLSRTAGARAEALMLVVSGTDRERADKIGRAELRQIAAALKPATTPEPKPQTPPAPTEPPAPAPAAASPPEEPAVAWPNATVEQVKLVQQALIDRHRLRGKADGAAGAATRAAIREFEKSAGLAETGLPSREVYVALTRAAPKPEPTRPEPSQEWPATAADQVRAIQRLLVELKLLSAEPTGTVGPLTRRAIRDYQHKTGLKETGEPSQALFDSLKAARQKPGG